MNNKINVVGYVESEPEFNHEVYGEKFYRFIVACPRKSNTKDFLPIIVSDRLVNINDITVGKAVDITGQIRSHNKRESKDSIKAKLIISVFATDLAFVGEEDIIPYMDNDVIIEGFVCKPPVYRVTPKGREIADMLIAVNRAYGKSDYIPCITWGRNARFAGNLDVGYGVVINGRLQSREYVKHLEDGTEVINTAYELSVSKIAYLE